MRVLRLAARCVLSLLSPLARAADEPDEQMPGAGSSSSSRALCSSSSPGHRRGRLLFWLSLLGSASEKFPPTLCDAY
jgi:hypothetical protein